uniref:RING-type E3 ubiquitin transferase n=1 Tax=Manihot esculenta TaxID=3983 RepID=A0A199U9I6_MANES
MVSDEPKRSPSEQRQSDPVETGQNVEGLFSPRFKSLAAMAGWDEESILIASLIVEDTPDRQFKHKKRSDLHFKTPPSASSRIIRRKKTEIVAKEERKTEGDELKKDDSGVSCSNSVFPCMDKLREELSCAICLEICFEPSTTSCGHR